MSFKKILIAFTYCKLTDYSRNIFILTLNGKSVLPQPLQISNLKVTENIFFVKSQKYITSQGMKIHDLLKNLVLWFP